MNASIVRSVRAQLARIAHLSVPALKAEVRTLLEAMPPEERERLRTLALVVVACSNVVGWKDGGR